MNYERDTIIRMLSASFVGESLSALSELYDKVEAETERFCDSYAIHCEKGCGTCCEHFMPDITPIEARMVASYLLLVKHDLTLIDRVMQSSGWDRCPLYDKENVHHCTVYPCRPLICRLFGQCASRDKEGNAEFRRCRYNVGETMPSHLELPDGVPVMDRYGVALCALDGGDSQDIADLGDAVAASLPAIQLVWSLVGKDIGDDDDDSTPSPRAS